MPIYIEINFVLNFFQFISIRKIPTVANFVYYGKTEFCGKLTFSIFVRREGTLSSITAY